MAELSPKEQLAGFLAKYEPRVAAAAKKALAAMRKRLPGALELVYDNYNALAIGFGPTERTSDVIFSIAVYPRWVSLFFYYGARLKDPKKLLRGSGNQVRYIVLDTTARLADPDVDALMNQAIAKAKIPLDPKQKHRLVIKSISPKQRPRRLVGSTYSQ